MRARATWALAWLLGAVLAAAGSAAEPEELREDPDRLRRHLASSMGAAEYLQALERTGARDALREPVGPAATDQWTEVGPKGGYGGGLQFSGRVAGLRLVDDGSGGYWIFAGASGGGIWRCHSGSLAAWTPVGQTMINPAVRAFAVDPNNTNHLVVCSGDPGRYRGAGVFATWNGGTSWAEASLPTVPDFFYRVEFRLGSSDILVAASDLGILQSFDGGLSWQFRWQGAGDPWNSPVTDLRLHPSNGLRMYAVAQGVGFLQSVDGGLTWGAVPGSTGLPAAAQWGRASLAINRDDPAALAVYIGDTSNNLLGVWRSLNNGVNWTEITGDLPDISQTQAFHAQAITFDPGDSDGLWVGSIELAHTSNGGAHWARDVDAPEFEVGHSDVTQLVISDVASDDRLWICNDGGLYLHNMTVANTVGLNGTGATGLRLTQIDQVEARRSLEVIGLQDNGQIKSVDNGTSWTHVQTGDGGKTVITDAEAVDFWYWMGANWHLNRVLGNAARRVLGTTGTASLHYDRFEQKIYYPEANVVRFAGAYDAEPVTFSDVPLPALHPSPGYSIWGIFGSQADGKTLYIKFRNANRRDLSVALWNGSTWTVSTTVALAPPDGVDAVGRPVASQIWSVAPSSERPGEAWVGFQAPAGAPKIVHTTDAGATWEDITAELASVRTVYAIAPTPFDPRTLYAATEIGIFRTTNGGQSWAPFQTGMPVIQCKDVKYVVDPDGGNHRLLTATYGRGLWSRDVPSRPIVYVDKTHTGSEDGSIERPYNTVAEGVNAAPAGAIVAMRGNTYFEPQTVNKNVLLVSWAGTSAIR